MDKDNVVPPAKWEFNEEVAKCFDDMLQRSIPSYETMRSLTWNLMHNYHVKQQSHVPDFNLNHFRGRFKLGSILDLGASRGEALRPFIESGHYSCDAIEVSEPMLDVLKELYGESDNVRIHNIDMRNPEFIQRNTDGMRKSFTGILSILTIQFTPIEYRMDILQEIYDSLSEGGMFIFVEKVLGSGAQINRVMVNTYHDSKNGNGYSQEDVERKRLSLEGVLVPQTASANEEMLKLAGFKHVDCFYRHLNFAGWVCIK